MKWMQGDPHVEGQPDVGIEIVEGEKHLAGSPSAVSGFKA
jgi:hypothetical protein